MAVTALLSVTGCSFVRDEPVPDVPAAGKGGGSTEQTKDADAIRQAWLRCMQEAGHTELRMTDDGRISMPAEGPGASDAEAARKAEARKEDTKKCNAKVPGMQQLQQKPAGGDMKAARNLAACLRENGLPEIADPKPEAGAALTVPPDVDAGAWNKAYGICGKKYPQVPFAAVPAK
ncbi:hypothetical protein [Streptomyces cavernae]|uniref:hypothetical protein n=1 Tax=Streptomyces cavernae TaxID=2259034 RepID=UPI000FEC08FF|nr:hypothetical protein [Streptomyces cavernae]